MGSEPRKPLTTVTWDDVDNYQVTRRTTGLGWPELVDLAYALADRIPHLDVPACRLLVDFADNGLPLVLTWETRLRRMAGPDTIETTRTTVLVESVTTVGGYVSMPGRVRIRYSGFGHEVCFPQIRAVVITYPSLSPGDDCPHRTRHATPTGVGVACTVLIRDQGQDLRALVLRAAGLAVASFGSGSTV